MTSLDPSSPPVENVEGDLARQLPVVFGPLQAIEALEHLAPALGLLGLLAGQVAADEVLGLLDLFLLALVFDAGPLEALAALDHVAVVPVGVTHEPAPLELDHLPAGALDEGPVVRDQDEGCRCIRRGTPPAARWPPGRGGWWARRAAAGRAWPPAPWPARAAPARRPTGCPPAGPGPPRPARRRRPAASPATRSRSRRRWCSARPARRSGPARAGRPPRAGPRAASSPRAGRPARRRARAGHPAPSPGSPGSATGAGIPGWPCPARGRPPGRAGAHRRGA